MQINEISVSELAECLELEAVNVAEPERKVTCGYAGDLLSWVMGRAPESCAWVTVMSNTNVIAVATLADVSCVIIAEGAELDAEALEKAKAAFVNVYASKLTVFELCAKIASLG